MPRSPAPGAAWRTLAFIGDALRADYTDLLFRVRLDGEPATERAHALWPIPQLMLWAFRYVLLDPEEFQRLRAPDPFMDAILDTRAR